MNWSAFWNGYWYGWRVAGPYAIVFLAGFMLGHYL